MPHRFLLNLGKRDSSRHSSKVTLTDHGSPPLVAAEVVAAEGHAGSLTLHRPPASPSRTRKRSAALLAPVAALAALAFVVSALVTGCVVDHTDAPPGPTEIEFGEVLNLRAACDTPLTSWTVVRRDTGDSGTAGCEQPVLFVTDITPGAEYTFDITGYAGQTLCFQGSCTVTAIGGATELADCSGQIAHLCGY